MWVLTVPSPRLRSAAISALLSPAPIRASTSRSRAVSTSSSRAGPRTAASPRYAASTRPVTAGSSQDPPPATTCTARCRSSAGMPFSTKPAAPARSAPASTSSSSNVVSTSTGGASSCSRSSAVARTPSTPGHPDVHQHDVRTQAAHRLGDTGPVRQLADDLEPERGAQDAPQPGPHQVLVVDQAAPASSSRPRLGRTRRPGQRGADPPPVATGSGVDVAAQRRRPLGHAVQADAVAVRDAGRRRRCARSARSRGSRPTAGPSTSAPGACRAVLVSASCRMR